MMTTIRGSSNAKAKRVLGWQPEYASCRDGFRRGLVAEQPPAKFVGTAWSRPFSVITEESGRREAHSDEPEGGARTPKKVVGKDKANRSQLSGRRRAIPN
jgi:hypothetical protein